MKDIERYPTYLKTDCNILETQWELYEITGDEEDMKDIIVQVSDMNEMVSKIRSKCKDCQRLATLVNDCDRVEYPVYVGDARSYISSVKKFKLQVGYVCSTYDAFASTYGIE